MYKIFLENKTKIALKYIFKNNNLKNSIKPINSNEIIVEYVDNTINNLYIYKENHPVWIGTVPSDTKLEIFEEDCKLDVYLDNHKIPAYLIDSYDCKKSDKNCTKVCYSNYIVIIFIFIIFILFFINKK